MSKRRLTWQDLSLEFVAGIFFVAALTLLIVFTVILGRGRFSLKSIDRTVSFSDVSGLSEGDNVQLFGVIVGRVHDVELGEQGVQVTLRLKRPLKLYLDCKTEIRYASVLGGRYVAIDPGTPASGLLPADAPLRGTAPADLVNETTQLIQELKDEVRSIRQTLNQEQVFPKLARIVSNFEFLSTGLRDGKGTLGKLLTDDALYVNSNRAMDNLGEITADLQAGKGSIGKLMTDDALYNDIQGLTADLRAGKGSLGKLMVDPSLYDNLNAASADLRKIAANASNGTSTVGRLLADNGELYISLQGTLQATQEIAESVRDGKGTLGKLVKDPALYDDTRQTILEVRGAVQDIREQTPISTFGSFLFGAF